MATNNTNLEKDKRITTAPVNPGMPPEMARDQAMRKQQMDSEQRILQAQRDQDNYLRLMNMNQAASTAKKTTKPAAPEQKGYQGAYDTQINDLYNQITGRQPFSYDVNGDALYQQYKDRYVENARQSMKDTMGQAAALTGGYSNSYAQGVGQQRYDETLRGLTDKIPELEQSAYQKYRDEGDRLQQQYGMLLDRDNTAYGRYRDTVADQQYQQKFDYQKERDTVADQQYQQNFNYQKERDAAADAWKERTYTDQQSQQAYADLASLITSTGYQADKADLKKAGMTKAQANALRQAWIAANPLAAYYQGALTAAQFLKLTGQQAPGTVVAAAANGGGPGGGGPKVDEDTLKLQQTINQNADLLGLQKVQETGIPDAATDAAAQQLAEYNRRMAIHYGR